MRLRILTLPDKTWTVVIDRVAPESLERLGNSKESVKEATGARGVLIVAGDEAELPAGDPQRGDVINITAPPGTLRRSGVGARAVP